VGNDGANADGNLEVVDGCGSNSILNSGGESTGGRVEVQVLVDLVGVVGVQFNPLLSVR
jgi:hypothetical protein